MTNWYNNPKIKKKKTKQVGPVAYLPPGQVATGTPVNAQGSNVASVSTSSFDADDNDLTHNTVPQQQVVSQSRPIPTQQQVVVTQPAQEVVHVQKIKVRRPRPPTVRIR